MPSNTLLTPDQITKEALRILHQKLNFIGRINRQYDDQFANEGAKIGDSLRIRKPVQYTVRSGKTINVQDTTEKKTDLTVADQKGVDMEFSSKELTMDLDNFSSRIIEPAMAVLSARMEADALSMYQDVYNQVDNIGSSMTFANILNARKFLTDNLAPMDNNRTVTLDTQANVDVVDALKGLFHSSEEISSQYRQGKVGSTAGFDFYENTLLPTHTTGTEDGNYVTNGSNQTGSTLTVDGGSGTMVEGDVFTIAGVNRVHPETKDDTGQLQLFTVTADYSGGAGDISISPEIITSGPYQNVSNAAGDGKSLTFHGNTSTADTHNITMAFHRDAFTFATADLVMPQGVDFASRQVYDGISMRIVRQYDINNDNYPCRIDVLYGYKAIREQLACRIAAN